MASLRFHFLTPQNPQRFPNHPSIPLRHHHHHQNCATTSTSQPNSENPPPPPPEPLELSKQRKSVILPEDRRRQRSLSKRDPPNLEIGWKRTKQISLEKPKGHVVMDFLEKLETLMGKGSYGSAELLAKVGGIVSERAVEEAEVLREEGEVEERRVTELRRVLRLMEMDLEMVKAARKEDTVKERVDQARARCRQAILVARSF
ncbi:hypothetical protein QJS04_geneDACA019834 [Acorus gramineus]|uniref:Chlororespiratory reduction 41 n=1 Tax=Acorus gramineus TaxID=55184 RepID=A0AAV9BT74_ACOGR|nr:hypothetical protein QJS04_geneDACA019834 [Acorus gramineus]